MAEMFARVFVEQLFTPAKQGQLFPISETWSDWTEGSFFFNDHTILRHLLYTFFFWKLEIFIN